MTTELLNRNLEFYTIWNYRRELITKLIPKDQLDIELTKELDFTLSCLKQHPKSYWVWNHRRWALESCRTSNWLQELQIVGKMLDLDVRNCNTW